MQESVDGGRGRGQGARGARADGVEAGGVDKAIGWSPRGRQEVEETPSAETLRLVESKARSELLESQLKQAQVEELFQSAIG